jgi:hypothetical protein
MQGDVGGVAGSQPMSTVQLYTGAQINIGDLTPYLICWGCFNKVQHGANTIKHSYGSGSISGFAVALLFELYNFDLFHAGNRFLIGT